MVIIMQTAMLGKERGWWCPLILSFVEGHERGAQTGQWFDKLTMSGTRVG